MVTLQQFHAAYVAVRTYPPNAEQKHAVDAACTAPLFLVAGPGTGKTTVLALRILKLILVDKIPPKSILATTFTVKAAAELRSRILSWGFQVVEELVKSAGLPKSTKDWLTKVDINQVLTGTVDSICERLLRDFRDPGKQPPVLADDYVSKTLFLREGLFPSRRFENDQLDEMLLDLHGGVRFGYHVGRKNTLLLGVWDRRFQDQLDWSGFVAAGRNADEKKARKVASDAIQDYQTALSDRGMVDFSLLEQEVLSRLQAGELGEFTEQIQVVLVDEYQDTNLLQERLYFELAKACGGALTVVGDDDQSLYRFRGATVELFSDYESRFQSAFGNPPTKIFLKTNYRSSQTIIQLVNDYATMDGAYQAVRVAAKPPLLPGPVAQAGVPILGMFRDDTQTLAEDLAEFVHRVFRGGGATLPDGTPITCDPSGGDVGDCALLCSSPAEYNGSGRERLPFLLREELRGQTPPVEVFNPRGQDTAGIRLVARFGGLILECLDPGGVIESTINGLPRDMLAAFADWRNEAVSFVTTGGAPKELEELAVAWADRDPKRKGYSWPREVSVLELLYALVHYLPELHDDPEGQVYLEVFTRQLQACEQVGKFKGRILYNPAKPGLGDASVKELIRDFLGPIASGAVAVNEELLDAFPRDRLSIFSIHQSKGLEFPMVIVDVGSDFRSNHAAHAFKRFPRGGGPTHRMEDLVRPHSTDPMLGSLGRQSVDRAFDDLIRQYFVAFSRPQEVLLLVGLTKTSPGGRVKNIATGWVRDGTCPWNGNLPYMEI